MNWGKNVLIVAAHPDDEVLGVGGTIAELIKRGINVQVLIVTDGSSSQYIDDKDKIRTKAVETLNALKKLGVETWHQWSLPDMRLDTLAHVELNRKIEKFIQSFEFDTVFCQNYGDINMDHKCLYDSVAVAVRPHPAQTVKLFLSYYVNSSSEWGGVLSGSMYSPNVYVDISKSIKDKLESMAEYKTELRDYPHPRSIRGIRNTAEYFGNMVGYEFAECFKLVYSR